MPATPLILRYRSRALRRWIGAHAFELFCLAPVIGGGAWWVLDRQLGHLREPLARYFSDDAQAAGTASLGLALILVGVALPATFRELYDHRRASGYLDALPVPPAARFHASLIVELTRAVPTLGVLLLAAGALGGDLLPPFSVLAERCARLAATLSVLAAGRLFAVLGLVHFSLLARGRWLAIGAFVSLAMLAPAPVRQWLLLPLLAPAAQLQMVFAGALEVTPATGSAAEPWALASTALILYLAARGAYLAWHRRDLEVAARLSGDPGRQWPRQWAPRLLGRLSRPGRPVAVQVARDLALVVRRFSQAVPLAIGLALMLDGAVLAVLAGDRLSDLWRARLAVTGLVLSVLAVVSLVPFLLRHQLPRFWIEKSSGVDLEQIWKAKLRTASLLATAPALTGTAMLLSAPLDPAVKLTASLQFLAAAWIVTSILGLAVFEIAAQPLLGLVFGSLIGLALAALFVFYPRAWWLWAVLYVYLAGQIAGRATRRVRLLEIGT